MEENENLENDNFEVAENQDDSGDFNESSVKVEEKPKTMKEIIAEAYDEAEKEGGDNDGKEKEGQGRQEVLKQADKKPEITEPALKPLDIWPEDVKAGFAKLPKEYQEFLLKREKDREAYFTKTTQEIAPIRKVSQTFQPFLAQVQQQYNQPADKVIGASLATLQTLVYGTPEQKLAEWMNVAQQYGIPVGQQAQQSNEWVDPDIASLKKQNEMLLQKINSIETGFLSKEEMAYQQDVNRVNNEIEEFINAKTETGEPVHPFASEPRVMQEMAVLTKAYQSSSLEVPPLKELYTKAVYSLPDIREKMLQREKEAALQNFKKQNSAKINQAKNAASGITQQSYQNGQFGKPKTNRQLLEEAWDSETTNRV